MTALVGAFIKHLCASVPGFRVVGLGFRGLGVFA